MENTEAKSRTEHTELSTVLSVNKEHVTPDPFKMEKFDKKVRCRIEVQPGDQVYIGRTPRRLRHLESGITGPLSGYSVGLQETVTEVSRKLLPRATSPYTPQSLTESTVTVDKLGVAITVSFDPVTERP